MTFANRSLVDYWVPFKGRCLPQGRHLFACKGVKDVYQPKAGTATRFTLSTGTPAWWMMRWALGPT